MKTLTFFLVFTLPLYCSKVGIQNESAYISLLGILLAALLAALLTDKAKQNRIGRDPLTDDRTICDHGSWKNTIMLTHDRDRYT